MYEYGEIPMKKLLKSTLLISSITLALSACEIDTNSSNDNTQASLSSSSTTQNKTTTTKSKVVLPPNYNGRMYTSFMKFVDIPMPSDSQLDLGHTVVMGGATNWIGRLSLDAPYKMSKMFDFYQKNMADFGWKSISTMRAESSVLTYQYDKRIATVTLVPEAIGNGTRVQFSIAPESKHANSVD